MYPADLPAEWRGTATVFREHANEPVAIAYERCAQALEKALVAGGEEVLTLGEAAQESGYSPDHLGRMIRERQLRNAGRMGAPAIRRRDLPMKAIRREAVAAAPTLPHTTNAQVVQSIIDRS